MYARLGRPDRDAAMSIAPEERPKARSLRPLRALLPFLRPYRGMLLLALGALLVAAAAMLALPIALRYLIDQGTRRRAARDTINRYFVAFLAAAGVFGVFAALRFYLVTWLGERVVADMRTAVYARVIRMDPSFFEVTRIGEVLSRLTADTTLVQSIAGVNLSITLRSAISLVGSLVMLARHEPRSSPLHDRGADAARDRAADRARPPRAQAVARRRRTASPTPAASPTRR